MKKYGHDFKILEVSLRDSSYIIDFSWPLDFVLKTAENLGRIFPQIEVGHGLGLGAWRLYPHSFKDEELLLSLIPLREKLKIQFLMFFIPGIAKLDDAILAKDLNLYGIRFGVNADEFEKNLVFLEKIKSLGFFTTLNLMKTYILSPKEVAKIAKKVKDFVDVFYLVDSAGTMLPENLQNYIFEVYDTVPEIVLGFHGHNNLGLATANALLALENGVFWIDTTLSGIGRSGGNVSTEAFWSILLKRGWADSEETLFQLINISLEFRHYIEQMGRYFSVNPEDVLYGYAGFHSSFEGIVREFCRQYQLDYVSFVVNLCHLSRSKVNQEILEQVLKTCENVRYF